MARFRSSLHRRHADQPVMQQIGAHRVYVRQEPAWAVAWPHVDDWFKPEAFFIWGGGQRLVVP